MYFAVFLMLCYIESGFKRSFKVESFHPIKTRKTICFGGSVDVLRKLLTNVLVFITY